MAMEIKVADNENWASPSKCFLISAFPTYGIFRCNLGRVCCVNEVRLGCYFSNCQNKGVLFLDL